MKNKLLIAVMSAAILTLSSASVLAATLGTAAPYRSSYSSIVSTVGPGWTWTTNNLTTGTGAKFTSSGTIATGGELFWLYASGLTSGDLLLLSLDNDNLTTGHYIRALGGAAMDTEVFGIGEDGATAITSAVATTNSLSILNNAATTGDLLTLTADSDNLTTGGYYIRALGGSASTTEVLSLAAGGVTAITQIATSGVGLTVTRDLASASTANEVVAIVQTHTGDDQAALTIKQDGTGNQITFDEDGSTVLAIASTGVITLGDGGTIDGITGTDVMNLTESTVRVTGALDVTGGFTTDTNAFAIADTTGVVTMKNGATLNNNASASTLTLTEDTVAVAGALSATGSAALDGGITVDTSNFTVDGSSGAMATASSMTADNIVCTNAATFGGGYATSGVTITTLGAINANAAITTDAALTATGVAALDGGITVDSTNFTVSGTTGAVSTASTITATGSTSGSIVLSPIAVGTAATTIQNQAGTITVTLPSATCTLPGLGLANTWSAANQFSSTVTGPAEGNMVINARHRVTTAEVNAGHTLVTATAGRSYRLVSCKAIAYGGAAAAVTTVDILGTQAAGSVKLVAYAQASLTQSTVLTDGGTGAAVLADGASYAACDANTAITIAKTGADMTTATGIDVILSYVVE